MLVVRVELHSAITGQVTELSKVVICNDGTSHDVRYGNYYGYVIRKGGKLNNKKAILKGRRGEVKGHARLREPVWSLVAKVLKSLGY